MRSPWTSTGRFAGGRSLCTRRWRRTRCAPLCGRSGARALVGGPSEVSLDGGDRAAAHADRPAVVGPGGGARATRSGWRSWPSTRRCQHCQHRQHQYKHGDPTDVFERNPHQMQTVKSSLKRCARAKRRCRRESVAMFRDGGGGGGVAGRPGDEPSSSSARRDRTREGMGWVGARVCNGGAYCANKRTPRGGREAGAEETATDGQGMRMEGVEVG